MLTIEHFLPFLQCKKLELPVETTGAALVLLITLLVCSYSLRR